MDKYKNALVEILNSLGNYKFYTTEVKVYIGYETKYILYIPADFDEGREVELSEEAYNLLVALDKEINGKWEE